MKQPVFGANYFYGVISEKLSEFPKIIFKIYFTDKFQDLKEIIYFSITNLKKDKEKSVVTEETHKKHLEKLVSKKYLKQEILNESEKTSSIKTSSDPDATN